MKLFEFLIIYFWPLSKPISKEGQQLLNDKISVWKKGNDFPGPRSTIGDDAIREQNKKSIGPHLHKYIKRWLGLAALFLLIALMGSELSWVIVEVLGTLLFIVTGMIALFWLWLKRDIETL